MKLVTALLLTLSLALFATGRAGAFMDYQMNAGLVTGHYGGHDNGQASHTSDQQPAHHAEHGHGHGHKSADGTNDDMICSSHCCTFACHLVTVDLRQTVPGPDFSYARGRPAKMPLLAGKQPPGSERPPRTA